MKSIYVGNLPYETTPKDLWALFESYGGVEHTNVVTDRETGRSRGFGFVEMSLDSQANRAIQSLHGTRLDGRSLIVTEARPRGTRLASDDPVRQRAS